MAKKVIIEGDLTPEERYDGVTSYEVYPNLVKISCDKGTLLLPIRNFERIWLVE